MKLEYGYATFDSGRILIETYKDGRFYKVGYATPNSFELEKIELEMDGYEYSEECTKKVQERIEWCKKRIKERNK